MRPETLYAIYTPLAHPLYFACGYWLATGDYVKVSIALLLLMLYSYIGTRLWLRVMKGVLRGEG